MIDEDFTRPNVSGDRRYPRRVGLKAQAEHAEVQGEWADLGQKISDLRSDKGAVGRERKRLQNEASRASERARAPVVRLRPSFVGG